MNFDILDLFNRDEFKLLFEDYCNIREEVRIEKEKDDEMEELMLSMHKHRREEKEQNDTASARRSKILFDSIFEDSEKYFDKSTVFIHDLDVLFE